MVKIKKNILGDTRTATRMPTREEFDKSNKWHQEDVFNLGFSFMLAVMDQLGRHDWTKTDEPFASMFYDNMRMVIEDGKDFFDGEWSRLHYEVHERHHLTRHCPDDVNLIDVIEMVCDCVAAGMARSGSVYDVEIPHDVLDKAIKNTVDMLISEIEVEER